MRATGSRPMFIVNPAAGRSRGGRVGDTVREHLKSKGIDDVELRFTERPGHATELAQAAAGAGFDPIVGVGGDGTLHEVANGLLRVADPPALGVVPAGTGNDFARSLGIPGAIAAAVDLVLTGSMRRTIDLGRCGERFFLNVGGVGFDAQLSKAVNAAPAALRFGALPFVLYTLLELVRKKNRPLTIRLDGRTIERRAFMVSVGNGPYSGGGMRICPDASRDDGLLDVCIVGDVSRLEVVRLLPKVFSGGHVGHPKVEFHRVKSVRIEGPDDAYAQVDGDVIGTVPVEFTSAPAALRVLMPTAGAPPPPK